LKDAAALDDHPGLQIAARDALGDALEATERTRDLRGDKRAGG
jgi:hypothetical protein